MKPQVNITAVVDVIGALSDGSLLGGNLCLVDNGDFASQSQGTPELCTVVVPGQVIQWTALAVDLQTPVDIRSITFLGGPGDSDTNGSAPGSSTGSDEGGESLELNVWTGVVPAYLTPGVPYRYRLELQMYEGDHSILHVDSPALMCA
ncbi:hypothetical protein AB0J38_14690 [Streptomyces sp. NPDC050095]|uniref:hypothetical protein n=1 Tax=unclassified Streptomyces TaxID=2593676 RepID=UPI00344A6464